MTENENKMLPIYLLVGDDEQKKETLTAKMKERCASFGEMSINTDVFDGEDHDPGNIVSSCLTLPFASEKRFNDSFFGCRKTCEKHAALQSNR